MWTRCHGCGGHDQGSNGVAQDFIRLNVFVQFWPPQIASRYSCRPIWRSWISSTRRLRYIQSGGTTTRKHDTQLCSAESLGHWIKKGRDTQCHHSFSHTMQPVITKLYTMTSRSLPHWLSDLLAGECQLVHASEVVDIVSQLSLSLPLSRSLSPLSPPSLSLSSSLSSLSLSLSPSLSLSLPLSLSPPPLSISLLFLERRMEVVIVHQCVCCEDKGRTWLAKTWYARRATYLDQNSYGSNT